MAGSECEVAQLLESLPDDQRQAIEARVVHERDDDEIAAATHTSEAVVGKRVSRGLGRLRRRLEETTP